MTSTTTPSGTTTAPSRSRALLGALFGTHTAPLPADVALVAARIVLAWVFVYHGSRRLFGWFDGPGIHDSAQVLRQHRGPAPGHASSR